jgi:hypothetical protein
MASNRTVRLVAACGAAVVVLAAAIGFTGSAGAVGPTTFEPTTSSCPTTTRCVALGSLFYDDGATVSSHPVVEVDFDPSAPSDQAPVQIDSGAYYNFLDCPSSSVCVATGGTTRPKAAVALVFDPAAPVEAKQITLPMDGGSAAAISCPSASQCVAVLQNLNDPVHMKAAIVTFNPKSRAVSNPIALPGSDSAMPFFINGIACPTSSQCTGVGASGHVVTFDPATGAGLDKPMSPASRQNIEISGSDKTYTAYPSYSAITCPTTDQCSATGKYSSSSNQPLTAIAVTFNPASGEPIGSGPAKLGDDDQSGSRFIDCPTTSACVTQTAPGATFATFQTGSGDISEAKTFDRKLPVGLDCATVSSCITVLNGTGEGEDHSNAAPEFDKFTPSSGSVTKTAAIKTTVSSGSGSSNPKLKAALAKCKKIKNKTRRAACVKKATKRFS